MMSSACDTDVAGRAVSVYAVMCHLKCGACLPA